ncbi:MAG: alpha/beta fold hydrolase [Polyangia bacterium]|jgi:dienelactone hydrolase
MKERIAQFGPGQTLMGIETPGAPNQSHPARPTWVFPNAGVVHRAGPHRLTVKLARRVALAGFPALRFDLSGLGDSRARSATTFEQAAVQDIRDAMDHLEQTTKASRFVLCGLCSGADNSVRAALADPRIAAIALLDPYAYRTIGFHVRRLVRRASNPASWQTLAARMGGVRRRFARQPRPALASDAESDGAPPRPMYGRPFPERSAFAADLRRIVDRGAHIFIVYSGGMDELYNHAGQFKAAFRRYRLGERIRTEFLPACNHTYTEIAQQRRLGDLLVAWAEGLFPAASANPRRQVGPVG